MGIVAARCLFSASPRYSLRVAFGVTSFDGMLYLLRLCSISASLKFLSSEFSLLIGKFSIPIFIELLEIRFYSVSSGRLAFTLRSVVSSSVKKMSKLIHIFYLPSLRDGSKSLTIRNDFSLRFELLSTKSLSCFSCLICSILASGPPIL